MTIHMVYKRLQKDCTNLKIKVLNVTKLSSRILRKLRTNGLLGLFDLYWRPKTEDYTEDYIEMIDYCSSGPKTLQKPRHKLAS